MDISDIFTFFCSVAGQREEASDKVAGGPVFVNQREGGGVPEEEGGVGGGRALGECLWGGGGGRLPPSKKVTLKATRKVTF